MPLNPNEPEDGETFTQEPEAMPCFQTDPDVALFGPREFAKVTYRSVSAVAARIAMTPLGCPGTGFHVAPPSSLR